MEAGREEQGEPIQKSEEQIICHDLLLDSGQHHQLSERKTGLKPATLSLEG